MIQEKVSEEFFDKYTCVKNHRTKNGPFNNCMFETYGEQYEHVADIKNNHNPKTIWTIVDGNDGWYGIVAGYHYINRIGYLITEQEWITGNEQYRII